MILHIKNKLISLGGGSVVKDDMGREMFRVKGKVFSPTKKKYICDMDGNRLFTVRNKFWHFIKNKALIYNADGERVAKVRDRWFSFSMEITDCEDDLDMQSNGLFRGRSIFKNGKELATWHYEVDLLRDAYRLEVFDESEAAFLVAMVIAVDKILDQNRS